LSVYALDTVTGAVYVEICYLLITFIALLGGFAIGARVALLWQHNVNHSYKLASIPRYDDIVWTLGGVCTRCWPVTGGWRQHSQSCTPYVGSGRRWLAGDWPLTGGVLNITAAAWTADFH